MKRVYIATALTCLAILAVLIGVLKLLNLTGGREHLTVGFIYDNDESTPYTYNFSLAKDAVEKKYGGRVTVFTNSNVLDDEMEEPLRALAEQGPCILVDRFASQALAGEGMHVYVSADLEQRSAELARQKGLGPAAARRQLKRRDR